MHQAGCPSPTMQTANFEAMCSFNPGTWAPLSHLTAVTSLAMGCGLVRNLPPQLAACTALLELLVNEHALLLGYDSSDEPHAYDPLQHLTALTKFEGPCAPAGLELLATSLRELRPTCQFFAPGEPNLASISRLTALTRLDLSAAIMHVFPIGLSACGALRELVMHRARLPELPEAAFQPLAHLTALSHLSLREVRLAAVPPALAAATGLLELALNPQYINEDGHFIRLVPELGHLSRLSSLTRLQVGCLCA